MMQIATVHSALGFVDYLFRASCLRGTGCVQEASVWVYYPQIDILLLRRWLLMFESLLWKWKSFQGGTGPLVLPLHSQ